MGFSDTATYFRTNDPTAFNAALGRILGAFGYAPDHSAQNTVVPSYHPHEETHELVFWTMPLGEELTRVYCSHPGIFTVHQGDYVPILQLVAGLAGVAAFEICVNDGDSMCLLETDGQQSRLTGAHSYVMDELYEQNKDMTFTPGTVFSLHGIKFPYQSLTVAPAIIPELLEHDFCYDMDDEIAHFERSVAGAALPPYYDADLAHGTAVFRYRRTGER